MDTPMDTPLSDDELPARAPPGETSHEYVSDLSTLRDQVGEHVMNALSDEDNVAVLSTVLVDRMGQQRILSIGLDAQMLSRVRDMVMSKREEKTQRIPCVGFHCFLEDHDEECPDDTPPVEHPDDDPACNE